jgi:hypothetical protein
VECDARGAKAFAKVGSCACTMADDDPDRSVSADQGAGGLRAWYTHHFRTPSQERRFISSVSFGLTFGLTRAVTHAIHDGVGPFGNVQVKGRHVHHMTFGILGLLGVGYAWLNDVGLPVDGRQTRPSRVTAALYGAGSALTLDEFALWLNLQDDYWTTQGRESIDAVVLFGALLSAGASARDHLADLFDRARRGLASGGARAD